MVIDLTEISIEWLWHLPEHVMLTKKHLHPIFFLFYTLRTYNHPRVYDESFSVYMYISNLLKINHQSNWTVIMEREWKESSTIINVKSIQIHSLCLSNYFLNKIINPCNQSVEIKNIFSFFIVALNFKESFLNYQSI